MTFDFSPSLFLCLDVRNVLHGSGVKEKKNILHTVKKGRVT
jgi:hypothetical protein